MWTRLNSVAAALTTVVLVSPTMSAHADEPGAKPAPTVVGTDLAATKSSAASDVTGNWLGEIDAKVIKLRLGFVIRSPKPNQFDATMFSIDQGNAEIPADSVELKDRKVSMAFKKIGGNFQGAWNSERSEIAGNWKQGTQSFPVTLKKVEVLPGVNRPQEPKKPYPYREEEVSFSNSTHRVTLKGTLTLPKGAGPFPAAVLISGSGPQDRNEAIAGHRPFLILADHLTRRGIAVLRFDDRDFEKPAEVHKATSDDLSHDVLAGVNFLRKRPEIAASKIGLIGHSEGGLIAPMLAAREKDVSFIVMIAGPGITGEAILVQQQEAMRIHAGMDEEARKKDRDTFQQWADIIKAEQNDGLAMKKIEAAFDISHPESDGPTKDALKNGVKILLTPWFRFFMSFDPRPTLTKVKCPVLAIIGEKDFQVVASDNLPVIEAALKEGGNPDFLVKNLPGLNHLLQPCVTGMVDEYSRIEITMAPEALKLIGDWIVERTSK